jgi:hypothetical protein
MEGARDLIEVLLCAACVCAGYGADFAVTATKFELS